MRVREDSSLQRARKRVLRAARDLAAEAHTQRHDEVFFALLARAVEALVVMADGDSTVLRVLWRDARAEEEEQNG